MRFDARLMTFRTPSGLCNIRLFRARSVIRFCGKARVWYAICSAISEASVVVDDKVRYFP